MAVRKSKKGAALKRWFKEEWIDVRTGKPCGRKKGEKRGVPYCHQRKKFRLKPLRRQVNCLNLKKRVEYHRRSV